MKPFRVLLVAALLVGGACLAAVVVSSAGSGSLWSSLRHSLGAGDGEAETVSSTAASSEGSRTRVQRAGLDELTRRFYERRDYRMAWLEAGRPSPAARAILEAIHRAPEEGLDAADYPIEPIERSLTGTVSGAGAVGGPDPSPTLPSGQLGALDARMSTVFLRYASDLATGRVDPRGIHPDWHLPPNEVDVAAQLEDALEKDQVPRWLAELPPPHPGYASLRRALASLRAEEASSAGASRGREASPVRTVSGTRGGARRSAAKPVPVVLPLAERVRRVTLAMERWRWAKRELGNPAIVINIPAFRLDVVSGERSILAMRIVAGKSFSPTPVFSDTITSLVFHPAWNIPDSIAREEILPAAIRNPRSLEEKGIHALSGFGEDAREVDLASLREPASGNLPFVLRQEPGPDNPLGRIKFLMPNKYDIYLHDSPAGHLFAKEERAFSHGCIRVEKPVELAETLLQGTEWDRATISRAMDEDETREVPLVRPMPVHILYMTAWVEEAGGLEFGDDVYRLDPVLDSLLSRSREERASLIRTAREEGGESR